jgi:PAS domain S-box-containing protein
MSTSPPDSYFSARTSLWERVLDWQPQKRSAWNRYGVAIVLTLLAAYIRVVLAPAESGGRFITFSLAVALSAIYGGFAAGMVSTLLGMLLVNFFLVQPYLSLAFSSPVEAFWLNLWHLITQLVVVGAIWQMQRKNRHLQAAALQVKDTQKRFMDTFEHAAAGITHVALDGRLLLVNQTFCNLVGYSVDELHHLRFQDITHPDDAGPDVSLLQEALEGLRSTYTLQKRYFHKRGHPVWAHLTVALMRKPDGTPDYFVSVVQDISSLKAAEDALRSSERLMEQAQALAGFVRWEGDLSTYQFRALGNSHRRLGLSKADFSGQDLIDLVHPDERERFSADWTAALKGVRSYNSSYRSIVSGEERWFSVRAEFERDAEGMALRAYGVTQEITDRVRAEQKVRQLNRSLERRIQERTRELKDAYDELESYSYAVAHDLRSPLRVINGFAQALAEDNPAMDAASQAHLEHIKGASRKMGQLIDGLLQLSQYARGELGLQPMSLSNLSTRMLEDLARVHPDRQVRWEVEPGLEIQGDPPLIEALMQNLLHNAWKYTASTEQAVIQVFSHISNGERHYCVRDNGAGFDMSRSQKLFQPFQRLHMPHEFTGLGIGLATARRIVLRHGGELKAQGEPGKGATFCFTLGTSPEANGAEASPQAAIGN